MRIISSKTSLACGLLLFLAVEGRQPTRDSPPLAFSTGLLSKHQGNQRIRHESQFISQSSFSSSSSKTSNSRLLAPAITRIPVSTAATPKGNDGAAARGGDNKNQDNKSSKKKRKAPKKSVKKERYAWFEPTLREIKSRYEDLRIAVRTELQEKRLANPETVPDNAEGIMDSLLREEMDKEIKETRKAMRLERYKEYESLGLEQVQTQDLEENAATDDEVVQEILEQSHEQFRQAQESRALVDDFERYERQAVVRSHEAEESIAKPDGEDLDSWTLDRLEDILAKQGDNDGLQESVKDLRETLKQQQNDMSFKPETYDDWQKYQLITKSMMEEKNKTATATTKKKNDTAVRSPDEVVDKLYEWKDFLQVEEQSRKNSGLASAPDMPFDFHKQRKGSKTLKEATPTASTKDERDPAQVLAEVNRKSVEVLEEVLERRRGTPGSELLEKRLQDLKATLEATDYVDKIPVKVEKVVDPLAPVDVSNVFNFELEPKPKEPPKPKSRKRVEEFSRFKKKAVKKKEKVEEPLEPEPPIESGGTPIVDEPVLDTPPSPPVEEVVSAKDSQQPPPPPPKTPFFTSDQDDEQKEVAEKKPQRPKTPFFAGMDENDEDEEKASPPKTPFFEQQEEDAQDADKEPKEKLGTMEEQKLLAMYRKAGARTEEEMSRIKSGWEEFQQYQSGQRDLSGLSQNDKSEELTADIDLGYNISDVVKDGDIDAEAVLASIRKRREAMKAKEKTAPKTPPPEPSPELPTDLPQAADKPRGGGRFSGGEFAKPASIDEETPDSTGGNGGSKEPSSFSGSEVFGNAGAQSTKAPPQQVQSKPTSMQSSFLGNEAFGDDGEVSKEDFEENRRRIQQYEGIEEEEKRKGLDVSDVLGRRAYEDDFDQDDYMFPSRDANADLSTFLTRKQNMLGYTYLSAADINGLMDLKDSLESDGVSRFIPRINKPFREFGAMFRLEGVLVDTTGLEYHAWKKVAETHDFDVPLLEDVRRASVTRPDEAIRRIFFWTSDVFLSRDVAKTHAKVLRELALPWLKKNKEDPQVAAQVKPSSGRVDESKKEPQGFMGLPFLSKPKQEKPANGDKAPNEPSTEEKVEAAKESWKILSRRYGFPEPDDATMVQAMKAGPGKAVTDTFDWAKTPVQKNQLVRQYYDILYAKLKNGVVVEEAPRVEEDIPPMVTVIPDAQPWIKSLLDVEMSCGIVSFLERDVVDALLDYAGLSDMIAKDKRVTASDGFSREGQQLLAAAIKLERRPDHCALFDTTPGCVVEAREVEIKSVGMTGVYPAYELLAADTTARDFTFLTAMNIRRLFGEKENQEPQLMTESTRPIVRRRVKTRFVDEDTRGGTDSDTRSSDDTGYVRWEDDDFKDWLFQ